MAKLGLIVPDGIYCWNPIAEGYGNICQFHDNECGTSVCEIFKGASLVTDSEGRVLRPACCTEKLIVE